ncbi:hypothetical protein KUTeg_020990 [Tegillarca granosa]|uniref:GRIP1-associated protein 1 n=1 Tax=Tegillarca granosa TaxID=220873 RepID=A0ABQ9E9I7_TEGGR|nr:hypothetical protein KUTeg_020990 [Tegillarca granosa]
MASSLSEEEFHRMQAIQKSKKAQLVAKNEELEKQVSELGENRPVESAVVSTQLEDEVRRLQAQNTALQKNLAACQEKLDKEHHHRTTQEAHLDKSSNEPNTENEDSFISEQALNLSLETELEEKKILKEQLTSSEKSYKDQILSLQEENEKISEKLKKKQESFMHLQEEKENLFAESNKKVEELQAARDRDQKYYTDQINKLQQELDRLKKVDAQNIVGNQQLQEQNTKLQQQLSELQQKFGSLRQEKDDLTVQLQKRSVELEKIKLQNEELKQQLQSLEETKGWLERNLKEVEESFTNYKEEKENHISSITKDHESVVCNLKEEHKTVLDGLREKHQQKLQECSDIEESLKQQLEKCQNEVQSLKQNVKDGVDERKIHEKKGMAMVKDLKRQLQAERKRAEKLQNKLEEILSDSKNNRSMEELFGQSDGNDSLHDERSSISSWNRNHTPPDNFDQEHNELVNRVAELQQEKWNLEEKLSHLETSTSAMAEDLIQKTRIIEHYVMESKKDPKPHHSQDDKLSLKKVLDLVNKGDDIHGIKEMNRKLQRMLEETLTKNMHLEQGMETLSQELMRLNKKEPEEKQEVSATSASPDTKESNQEETIQDS